MTRFNWDHALNAAKAAVKRGQSREQFLVEYSFSPDSTSASGDGVLKAICQAYDEASGKPEQERT
jgi:hypothetical protein